MRLAREILRQCVNEISRSSVYFDELVSVEEPGWSEDFVFSLLQAPKKSRVARVEDLSFPEDPDHRPLVVFCGTLNTSLDIEALFRELSVRVPRGGRIQFLTFSPYYSWIYRRQGMHTFLTEDSLLNLATLAGLQLVRSRPVGMFPFRWFGLGRWIGRLISALPGIRIFCPATVLTLRPLKRDSRKPSLSIVVPARNEEGNIPRILPELPHFNGVEVEVVFVEGNSTDGTWQAIQDVQRNYPGPHRIVTLRQTGKGKNNAVREGFEVASRELFVILDADLTMPAAMLTRFYDAYVSGHGDFVNGTRLVYPMEGGAMRFLNRLGNVFFVKALNFCLENRITDTLCGTKLIRGSDYRRLKVWRARFGDFDPFGDFELVFFASLSSLGIVDIPVRYRARTYGETNIRRFHDGFVLLRMTLIAFFRIRI
jgi:hypothetical protein